MLLPFLLGSLRRSEALVDFCPLHADLHLQTAERKFLWLDGMLVG